MFGSLGDVIGYSNWLVLCDERMGIWFPFSVLNDKQRVATGWALSAGSKHIEFSAIHEN